MSAGRIVLAAVLIASLALVACGGGGGGKATATKALTKTTTRQRTITATKTITGTPPASMPSPRVEPTEAPAQPSETPAATDMPPAPPPTDTPPPVVSTTVDVALVEFDVRPSITEASPGRFTFRAHNDGTIPHDLLVIMTSLPENALPVDEETNRMDESQVEVIGRLPSLATKEFAELPLELSAGPYVLICNVTYHYSAGMYASFSVEQGLTPHSQPREPGRPGGCITV